MAPVESIEAPAREGELVFLGGFPSGGTDLLMSVLNAHPQVFIPGEFPFLAGLADRYGPTVPAAHVDRLVADLRHSDAYNNFVHHHWRNFLANRRDPVELGPLPAADDAEYRIADVYRWLLGVPAEVRVCGNKTPSNTENIDRLRRLFPEARFVVISRDIRDVALSWERKWGRDQLLTAHKYNRRMLLGLEHAADLGATRTCFVRFEDLLDDLERACRRLCEFLGLEFDPEMLRFHEHVTKQIDGKPNWGKPLIAGNHSRWRERIAPERVERIEEVAFEAMTALGYRPQAARGPRRLRRWELARGRARDISSTLAVNNRYQRGERLSSHLKNVAFNVRKVVSQRSMIR